MKIWFDLTNSPHVNFFSGIINCLRQKHAILLTCRPLANTIELLDIAGFPYSVVGKHYGRSKFRKSIGFFIRIYQLYKFVRPYKIDVAISHSSFYSPVVSHLLGCRCIYLNDNEHAAGNRISFFFANKIMVPEFLSTKKVVQQGALEQKIIQYPGVKEGVYLWETFVTENHEYRKKIDDKKKTIYVRPEPWTAQYYKGNQNFMDELLLSLASVDTIKLLPRGTKQIQYYKQEKFKKIEVLEKSIPLSEIMKTCDLFIGAGGTMTREAAVLGIPTISIYQDELLDVDRYLLSTGAMIHTIRPTRSLVLEYMDKMAKRAPEKELMHKGKQAYEMIINTLLHDN
jgi:predicted glycosyltransferase